MLSGKILFCDMDGTLARFYENPDAVQLYRTVPDYFLCLRPYESLVKALVMLMDDGVEVVILSAVDDDIRESTIQQKVEWLRNVFSPYGRIPDALFPPTGKSKIEYVKSVYGDAGDFFLLDDYSCNLLDWTEHLGTALKAINEINGHGGKFAGVRIPVESDADTIYQSLRSVMS